MRKFYLSTKMKKEIIGGSAIVLIFFAAIFIPVNTYNYDNETIDLNGTVYSNLTIDEFYKIKSYMIVSEQSGFRQIDTLLRYNIREFLLIKKINFPKYGSPNMSIELIQNNSDKIANFTYFYEVDYYLLNDQETYSKQINLTGLVIFRNGNIKNPETHLDFEI